jgi:hypothetical protein
MPEDPEDEKKIGLWLDQGVSYGLSDNKSLEVSFHERFDERGVEHVRVPRSGWGRLPPVVVLYFKSKLSLPTFPR